MPGSGSVVVERFLGCLGRVFFFFQGQLEPSKLLLHVGVDPQVTSHDHFHLVHVVVDVAVFRILPLDILDQLSLLSDHVCDLLQVLEVVSAELFLLFHDVVYLLVESE